MNLDEHTWTRGQATCFWKLGRDKSDHPNACGAISFRLEVLANLRDGDSAWRRAAKLWPSSPSPWCHFCRDQTSRIACKVKLKGPKGHMWLSVSSAKLLPEIFWEIHPVPHKHNMFDSHLSAGEDPSAAKHPNTKNTTWLNQYTIHTSSSIFLR